MYVSKLRPKFLNNYTFMPIFFKYNKLSTPKYPEHIDTSIAAQISRTML
jgi:hypothetical protein